MFKIHVLGSDVPMDASIPFDLPVVVAGLTWEQAKQWANDKGLTWVYESQNLFKGYWRDADGVCYLLNTDK